MRQIFIAILLIAFINDSVAAPDRSPASESKHVLITAFEPFGSSKENHSAFVAREVAQLAKRANESIQVTVCILPVVYDVASDVARRCFQEMPKQADLVISLGEAGNSIRIELVGENHNSTLMTDNSGEVAPSEIISRNGPRWIPSTLPLYKLSATSLNSQEWAKTEFSSSAGAYVCNNTAYTLGEYFGKLRIPYGFIHVAAYSNLKMREREALAQGSPPWITQVTGSTIFKLIKMSLATDSKGEDHRKQMRTFFSKNLDRKIKVKL